MRFYLIILLLVSYVQALSVEMPPLWDAVTYEDVARCRKLIAAGEDVNADDYLHTAALLGNEAICALLISAGADVNKKDYRSETPLDKAASRAHLNIVRRLVAAGAKLDHWPPLHIAALMGRTSECRRLIAAGADVNQSMGPDELIPLHRAARSGHVGICLLLLQHGAQVLATTKDGCTALHLAAKGGHPRTCQLLIRAGTPVDALEKYRYTPLHYAAESNHPATVAILLRHGADVKAKSGGRGRTPLHYAAGCSGGAECTRLLIAAGANVHAKLDPLKNTHFMGSPLTPLFSVADPETCSVLLAAGARPNEVNEDGESPLHYIVQQLRGVNVVRRLLQAGADPNLRNSFGRTPLHYAAFKAKDHPEYYRLLRAYGADDSIPDDQGSTPADLYRTFKHF